MLCISQNEIVVKIVYYNLSNSLIVTKESIIYLPNNMTMQINKILPYLSVDEQFVGIELERSTVDRRTLAVSRLKNK